MARPHRSPRVRIESPHSEYHGLDGRHLATRKGFATVEFLLNDGSVAFADFMLAELVPSPDVRPSAEQREELRAFLHEAAGTPSRELALQMRHMTGLPYDEQLVYDLQKRFRAPRTAQTPKMTIDRLARSRWTSSPSRGEYRPWQSCRVGA